MNPLGISTAFRCITIIPVPGKDCEKAAQSLIWFPLVGLVLGMIGFILAYLFFYLQNADFAPVYLKESGNFTLVAGGSIVALWAFLTRGFHLDGLADMFDGFGGGWTAQRSLEIMKDSRLGSFGAIALCLLLVIKTAALGTLFGAGYLLYIIAIPIISRLMMVYQASFNQYARPKPGTAGEVVAQANSNHFFTSLFVAAILLAFVLPSNMWLGTGIISLAALAVTLIVGYFSRKKIAGVTGDILGATCELSETFALVAACFVTF